MLVARAAGGKAELLHLVDILRADVAGHDDDRVAEVDLAALGVGQGARVEHLQEDVKDLRVRLFYLVKQQHRVRPVAHQLGEGSALLVADIARRRADDFADAVLLHILRHVDADERLFVVKHKLGERFGELGLPHPGGPEEHKRGDGAVGVGDARAAAFDRVGDFLHRLGLADYATLELRLDAVKPLGLLLEHARHGDAGPLGHYRGDVALGYLFFKDAARGLQLFEPLHLLFQLALEARYLAVADLGRARQVHRRLGRVGLDAQALELFFDFFDVLEDLLFVLPPRLYLAGLFAQVGNLLFYHFDAGAGLLSGGHSSGLLPRLMLGGGVFAQRLLFHLEPHDAAMRVLQHRRLVFQRDAQRGGRLVDKVDGFVGQKAVRDVPRGQLDRGNERRVGDMHPVEELILLLQSAQYCDRVVGAGLQHVDRLEAPLEGRVALDVLLVLAQGGGADDVQVAARQRGFEHVGGVHRALGGARAYHRVYLVYKEDYFALGALDFFNDSFEPLLKLAAVLGAGNKGAEVERHQVFVAQ